MATSVLHAQEWTVVRAIEYGTFAVMKVSYNVDNEDSTVVAKICGSGFFVLDTLAITANHVLPVDGCVPDNGRQRCTYYLVSRLFGEAIPLHWHTLIHIPEIDVCMIRLPRGSGMIRPYTIDRVFLLDVLIVLGLGHHSGLAPVDAAARLNNRLYTNKIPLDSLRNDLVGVVIDMGPVTVDADLKLTDVESILVSFKAVEGMSGGPLIDIPTGRIVGMMSFGPPKEGETRAACFAISINRIIEELRLRGIDYRPVLGVGNTSVPTLVE